MINGYEFYKMFQALMMHFSDKNNYCYFKYKGKTRLNENSYIKTKARHSYEKFAFKLQTHEKSEITIATNFLLNDSFSFIIQLKPEMYNLIFDWKENLLYNFEESYKIYKNKNLIDIIECEESINSNTNPLIYITIFNILTNGRYFSQYEKNNPDDLIWEYSYKIILTRYQPFLEKFLFENNNNNREIIFQKVLDIVKRNINNT